MADLDKEVQALDNAKKELDEVRENYCMHLSIHEDVLVRLDDILCNICRSIAESYTCTKEDLRYINTYVKVSHELREVYKARRKLCSIIQDECRDRIADIWNDGEV